MCQHGLDCSEDTFLGVIILHHLKSNDTLKEIADDILNLSASVRTNENQNMLCYTWKYLHLFVQW